MTKWKRFLPFVCETENQIQIPPKKTHVCILQLYRCIPCIPCHNLPNSVPQIQIRYLLFVFASDKMLYFVKISQGLCQTMSQSDTSNQHCCLRLFPRILDFCLKKDLKNRLRMRGCLQQNPCFCTTHNIIPKNFTKVFNALLEYLAWWLSFFFSSKCMCRRCPVSHLSHWIDLNWIEKKKKRNESIKHRKKAAHKPITFFVIKCSP